MQSSIQEAAEWIRNSSRTVVFTGAGISVESGIPAFRGEDGLWKKYDPRVLEIDYFRDHPAQSWAMLREIFYTFLEKAQPNPAHRGLAALEKKNLLRAVITQNIDHLHRAAGSRIVHELHGSLRRLVCLSCTKTSPLSEIDFEHLPPTCRICGGLIKPDIVFFGEPLPQSALSQAFVEAQHAEVLLVIGTTGEVMPAAMIPQMAKEHGGKIIEINTKKSQFTEQITDLFLEASASVAMSELLTKLQI